MKRATATLAGVVILIAVDPTCAGMISLPSEQSLSHVTVTAPSAAAPSDQHTGAPRELTRALGELTSADSELTGAASQAPSLSLLDLVFDQDRHEAVRHEPLAAAGIRALQEVSTDWQPRIDEVVSQPASSLAAIWPELSKDLAVDEPPRRPAWTVRVVEPTSFFLLLLGLAGFGLHCLRRARTGVRQ